MAPHSSILAWKIPWTEEPGGLQSMGSLRVGHDWATSLSLFTFMYWRRKWQPTPVFLPGDSQGRGTWWAAVYGVAKSRTWLKWLSSSSSRLTIFLWNLLVMRQPGHSHYVSVDPSPMSSIWTEVMHTDRCQVNGDITSFTVLAKILSSSLVL